MNVLRLSLCEVVLLVSIISVWYVVIGLWLMSVVVWLYVSLVVWYYLSSASLMVSSGRLVKNGSCSSACVLNVCRIVSVVV